MKNKTIHKHYQILVRVYYDNNQRETIILHALSIDIELAINSAKYYLKNHYNSFDIVSIELKED